MILTLDKWIKEVQKPCGNVSVFIDYTDIIPYFQAQDKNIDHTKLINYLKNRFGKNIIPYLYMGAYDRGYIASKNFNEQEELFSQIAALGFNIKRCIKYLKNSKIITTKGSEVFVAIDLDHYAHLNLNKSDSAVLLCDDIIRYRKVINMLTTKYGIKIKVFSLSQEYEENYQEFTEFINDVGKPVKCVPYKENIPEIIKTAEISQKLNLLNQRNLRERIKRAEKNNKIKMVQKDTYIYIDYGNVRHSLIELKRKNSQFKNLTETDFFLMLKSKAQTNNNVKKIKIYMGIPQIKIDELKALRKKQEKLKTSLEKNGFEVYFLYNEVLFKGGMKERGVDLSIGFDIIDCALENEFDKVILISGDADFVPVVRKLKEIEKEIEIWSFTKPERNSPLSPYLVNELCENGEIYNKIKSINSLLHC